LGWVIANPAKRKGELLDATDRFYMLQGACGSHSDRLGRHACAGYAPKARLHVGRFGDNGFELM
jgi:hypothetical protein